MVPASLDWPTANEDPSLAILAKKLPPYPAGNHYDEGQDVPNVSCHRGLPGAGLRGMACRCTRNRIQVSPAQAGSAAGYGIPEPRIVLQGITYRFQVYLPEEWRRDDGKRWPIILSLHGRGERGSEGMWQTQVGIAEAVRNHPDRWPFVIVMPQCPQTPTGPIPPCSIWRWPRSTRSRPSFTATRRAPI
jgi:hypothetical protein